MCPCVLPVRPAPPVFSQAQDARSWAGALDDFQGRRGRPPYPTSLLERRVGLAGEKTYPEEVTMPSLARPHHAISQYVLKIQII